MVKIPDFMISPEVPQRSQDPWVRKPSSSAGSELEDLLAYIDAGCGYDEWVQVLMAIHHETGGSIDGLSIADRWSATGNNYTGSKDVSAKWRSFKASGGVTIATIAQRAALGGADLATIAARHGRGEYATEISDETLREWREISDRLWKSFNQRDGFTTSLETGEVVDVDDPDRRNQDDTIGGALEYFDLPDSQLRPGGVIEEITNWICDWASEPIRIHAVGAALLVVGTLIGRKVFSFTKPTGTALYAGILTPSGVGKQHTINCLRLALSEGAGSFDVTMGWQQSLPSLTNALANTRASCVMVVDELADKLTSLRSRSASTSQVAISEGLRTLWGINIDTYIPDMSLSSSARGIREIHRPALSILGASTLKDFRRALVSKDVTNGFFNRFLLLPRYGQVPSIEERDDVMTLPDGLKQRLKWLYNCLPSSVDNTNLGSDYPKQPIMVPFAGIARDMHEENRRFAKEMMAASEDDDALALYGRYAEQIKRIALILACGKSPADLGQAVITEADMEFGKLLVSYSIQQFVLMVRRELVENESQRNHNLVLEIIRNAGPDGILKSSVTKKLKGRLIGRPYEDVLKQLIEAGVIKVRAVPPGHIGRPPMHLTFVKGSA